MRHASHCLSRPAWIGALAGHFTDRTVVTYDPRGAGRSKRTDGASQTTVEEQADDLHRLIGALGAGRVDIFASSGGAVNALALADPDGEFDHVDAADAEQDFATYRREIELAREAAAGRELDETFFPPRRNTDMSLRWVYMHMTEEYARHNDHANLLRERIDGARGY